MSLPSLFFLIARLVTITLIAVAWSSPAFCDETHDAARDGDLTKVKALLKENPDLVFSKDKDGDTPLHLAAVMGHKDVAELLLAIRPMSMLRESLGPPKLCLAVIRHAFRSRGAEP